METIPSGAINGASDALAAATPDAEFVFASDPRPQFAPVAQATARARSEAASRSALIYSPQFNTIGGVETHLVRLSCFLAKQNWRVTLVTTSGMLENTRVEELRAQGVEFIAPSGNAALSVPRKALWLASLVATQLRWRHWDVVYTNAQGSLSWLLAPLKRRGVRFIHHYHTAGDERDHATWGRLFPQWLRLVDEIVACSTTTAKNLRRVLPPACTTGRDHRDKIRVIRYLSEESISSSVSPSPETRDKLRFGFVGRLVRGKGIDMICALSEDPKLAHIEWHVHGCGADYDAAHFERFPNIHYHGRYNGAAELGAILGGLDALALFSQYQEGQPISLIEGMSAGLPWVATDQGGTQELMWSPSNCRLVPAECRYEDALAAVLDLASAIREGKTSRVAQRGAYDDNLAPQIVGERWLEFLATKPAPKFGFLGDAAPVLR